MKYTELMSVLDDCCDKQTTIVIYMDNGCIFKSTGNTGVFETNNSYDITEEGYSEYYACAVGITEILQNPETDNFNPEFGELKAGNLIEISEFNEPLKIELEDHTIIWEKV